MRKFSYASVLGQLSVYFQVAVKTREERLERLPFVVERLALWVLRDDPQMYGSSTMALKDLNRCINQAWSDVDQSIDWSDFAKNDVSLMFRPVLLSQGVYQRSFDLGAFVRQIDLLKKIEPNSKLRLALDDALGMSAEQYMKIAAFFWHLEDHDPYRPLKPDYRQHLFNAFGEQDSQRFFKTIIHPAEQARNSLKVRQITEDEWFQPTVLYRHPYVVYGNKIHFWGAPTLRRHLEFKFSDIVSDSSDATVRRGFEAYFETYVKDVLSRSDLEMLDEDGIRSRFGVDSGGCCDFALIEGKRVILFEVKNKALTHTFPSAGTARDYKTKLKATVMKAFEQLNNVEGFVRRNSTDTELDVHKVVVTYGELLFGFAEYLDAKSVASAHSPLILNVGDLEYLVESVKRGQCSFDQFFQECHTEHAQGAEGRGYSPGDLLRNKPFCADKPPEHLLAITSEFFDGIRQRFHGIGLGKKEELT